MATASATPSKIVPSEVGWQFVPQYYTYVNKQPGRLHCFYTKNSTFIHGTEGEDGVPCYGQLEIHQKITSIGFENCKVFIHSVDAQASANNGIIIQVIGEMSNRGEPWRKFAQTFFLAEQPNGYFVLNDIFRFLKEDTDDDAATEGSLNNEEVPAASTIPAPEADASAPAEPTTSYPATFDTAPQTNGVTEHEKEESVNEPEPVTTAAELTPEPSPAPAAETPVQLDVPTTTVESIPAVAPATTISAAEPTEVVAEEPAPVPSVDAVVATAPTPAPTTIPAPAATPAKTEPPAKPEPPKSWAALAARNAGKSALASDQKGVSVPRAPSPTPPPQHHQHKGGLNGYANKGGANGSANGSANAGDARSHPSYIAAQSVTTAHCFVKSVIEPVDNTLLKAALSARFGPLVSVEVVKNKACAFVEFQSLDAAKRAIVASLPPSAGGDGGVRISLAPGADHAVNPSRDNREGTGTVRITVETRKEKGERPPARPRGGAPPSGEQRGAGAGATGAGRGAGGGRGRGDANAAAVAPSNNAK